MIDRKLAVQEINSMFSIAGYPEDFLDHYDQIECLASRHGRETFLVEEKRTHKLCIAKCYDAALYRDIEEQPLYGSGKEGKGVVHI